MVVRATQRHGYVLVLTLAVIALAAISLAGLARYSLGLATCAQESVEELQHRWGLYSVRHMLLDRAADIIDGQTPPQEAYTPPWPKPNRVSTQFRLGANRYAVLIADEDAKVNLNTVYRKRPKDASSVIRRLSRTEGFGNLAVRLRPQPGVRSPFSSWGQVFDLANIATSNSATHLATAGCEMTCWSSEKINLRRVSDAAIREVAGLTLTAKQVGKLVELRKNWGGRSVEELLAQLSLRRPDMLAAERLLSVGSHRYSMWVHVDNGQRVRSYQFVDDGGPVCFAW